MHIKGVMIELKQGLVNECHCPVQFLLYCLTLQIQALHLIL